MRVHKCALVQGASAPVWGPGWGVRLCMGVHWCKVGSGVECASVQGQCWVRVCTRVHSCEGHIGACKRACAGVHQCSLGRVCAQACIDTCSQPVRVCVCVYTHTRVQAAHGAAPVPPGALVLLLSPLSPHARVHGSSHALARPGTPLHTRARPGTPLARAEPH